ncbi:HAD-IA family hydrolase [Telmatobacter bradus]|uniref:HAD-IA family hydrolase n=1 Tax=Telmatobacter bradus TaxID=474953 RepID=UPI003B42E2F9
MAGVEAILFDVGGVLLTNGWDLRDRTAVLEHFELDQNEFEARHKEVYTQWDTGQITVDQYLEATVFHTPRSFRSEAFFLAICERSQLLEGGAIGILEEIAASNKYLLGSLNNEPRETNEYRFRRFQLGRFLRLRLTSSYLGLRKPDPAVYHRALDILGIPADRVLLIDDRQENVDTAAFVGLQAMLYENAAQLRRELTGMGIL